MQGGNSESDNEEGEEEEEKESDPVVEPETASAPSGKDPKTKKDTKEKKKKAKESGDAPGHAEGVGKEAERRQNTTPSQEVPKDDTPKGPQVEAPEDSSAPATDPSFLLAGVPIFTLILSKGQQIQEAIERI